MQENKQSVLIEQRKNITINGVESVSAFSESKILLLMLGGEKWSVSGSGLKITGFSKTSGLFTAEGTIAAVAFGANGVVSKLFK